MPGAIPRRPSRRSALVTAVGFMPNGFAQSTAGEYASNVFWIVGIALEDCLLDCGGDFYPLAGGAPVVAGQKTRGGRPRRLYDTPRYQRFRRLLTRVIARKWRVAAGVVALFIVAILGMSVVKKQFFPTSDRPEVLVEVQLPSGSSIARPAPRRRKLSTGCSGSRRRRLSPAISARARRAFTWRWLAKYRRSLPRQTGGVDRRAGCPRGAQAAAAGGGGQSPPHRSAGARHSAGVWPLFALSGRLAGDGARSARSLRHRQAG